MGELVQKTVDASGGDVAILDIDAIHAEAMFPSMRAHEAAYRNWALSSSCEEEIKCSQRVLRRLLCDNGSCCAHRFDLSATIVSDDQRCLISADNQSLAVFMNHVLFHLDKSETLAIGRIHGFIRKRHQTMLGDVLHSDHWKQYGSTDSIAGALLEYGAILLSEVT